MSNTNLFCQTLCTNVKAEAGWDQVVHLMSAAVHTPAMFHGDAVPTPSDVADALLLAVTL